MNRRIYTVGIAGGATTTTIVPRNSVLDAITISWGLSGGAVGDAAEVSATIGGPYVNVLAGTGVTDPYTIVFARVSNTIAVGSIYETRTFPLALSLVERQVISLTLVSGVATCFAAFTLLFWE